MFFLISIIILGILTFASWIPGVAKNTIGVTDIIPTIWESAKEILSFDGNGLAIIAFAFLLYALLQSKSVQALFASKRKWLQKRRFLTIAIITISASFLASHLWWADEFFHFYPLVVPLLLSMGFDTISAILCLYGGGIIGVIGSMSTENYGHVFRKYANRGDVNFSGSDGLIFRTIVWVILTALIVFFNIWYCNRVYRASNQKKITNQEQEAIKIPAFNWKKKFILLLSFFFILVSVLGTLSWSTKVIEKVGIKQEKVPQKIAGNLQDETKHTKLGKVDVVVGKDEKGEPEKMEIARVTKEKKTYWGKFGEWSTAQVVYWLTIGAIIICLIDRQNIISTLVITITKTAPIIVTYIFSYAIITMVKSMDLNINLAKLLPEKATKIPPGLIIFPVLFGVFFLCYFFSIAIMPLFEKLVDPLKGFSKNTLLYGVIICLMARFVSMGLSPFSGNLQTTLQINKVSYKTYLKKTWFLWFMVFLITLGLICSLPFFIDRNR